MTLLLLTASAALAVLAVSLFRSAGAGSRTGRGLAHLAAYQQLGRSGPVEVRSGSERPSVRLTGLLEALGSRVIPRTSPARVEALRHRLRSAGLYEVSAETYTGARLAVTGAGILLAVLLGAASGPGALFFFCAASCFFGYAVPTVLVSRRARLRTAAIDKQMPELVDLLVVAVEAGLGLGAALERAAVRMTGALGDELRLVLEEQSLGATSAEALEHFVIRSDTPAVRTFVRTLVQSDKLGVPIGQTMRAIALDMRKRRRAAAEAQAQKAPIKILFPLVFCIFPSLMLVIMAPAVITIMKELG